MEILAKSTAFPEPGMGAAVSDSSSPFFSPIQDGGSQWHGEQCMEVCVTLADNHHQILDAYTRSLSQ